MNTLLLLILTFAKIGLFSIGGGYAMIPMIQQEVVSNGWMLPEEVADVVAISQMTPGPFALNAATFVGTRVMGVSGAIAATFGVLLPSIVIVLIIARFFLKFQEKQIVKSVMHGVRPVVVALIAASMLTIAQTALFANGIMWQFDWWAVGISVLCTFALLKLKMHPILMIALAAAAGVLLEFVAPL